MKQPFASSARFEAAGTFFPRRIGHGDHGINLAMQFVDHIKLNREGGLAGRLAGAALAIPGVAGQLKKGLEKDYRENLY